MLKNFSKLFAGNVAVQVITLSFYPILGRIYSPSDFGFFSAISSLSIVLSIFMSGQLHMAFPQLDEKSSEGIELLRLCINYCLLTSIIVASLSCIGCFDFLFDKGGRAEWYLIPIFSLVYTLSEITKMWLNYMRTYTKSSIFVSLNRLLANCLKVVFPASVGLIWSEVMSNLFSFLLVMRSQIKNIFTTKPSISLLIKHSNFPLFYTFAIVAQSLQQELPVFMIRSLFSSHYVGLYSIANKFTVQSVLLVSASLVLVLANNKKDSGSKRIQKEFLMISKYVIPSTVIAYLVLYNWGELIFSHFMGDKWAGVGNISSFLIWLVISKMAFVPVYAEILRSGKVRLIALLRVIQTILSISYFQIMRGEEFYVVVKGYVLFDFTSDMIITFVSYFFISKPEEI